MQAGVTDVGLSPDLRPSASSTRRSRCAGQRLVAPASRCSAVTEIQGIRLDTKRCFARGPRPRG
jgi:hypothetical protein